MCIQKAPSASEGLFEFNSNYAINTVLINNLLLFRQIALKPQGFKTRVWRLALSGSEFL